MRLMKTIPLLTTRILRRRHPPRRPPRKMKIAYKKYLMMTVINQRKPRKEIRRPRRKSELFTCHGLTRFGQEHPKGVGEQTPAEPFVILIITWHLQLNAKRTIIP